MKIPKSNSSFLIYLAVVFGVLLIMGTSPVAFAQDAADGTEQSADEGDSLLDLIDEEGGSEEGDSLLDLVDEEGSEEGDSLLDLVDEEGGEEATETETVDATDDAEAAGDVAHTALMSEDRFPSATACASCHPTHFEQWSRSQHAYSQLSPVFNAFHATLLKATNGTNGDFCIRCHTPVGMNLGEPLYISNLDRHPTSREGVTCIACHRLSKPYGIVSGRLAIEEGSVFKTVYGPQGGEELARVIESDEYVVNDNPEKSGRDIHTQAVKFEQISESGFCATCHDVRFVNGFRLEDAFSEYKSSPAARQGESCQDCHMGKVQGIPSGYNHGPAAVVGGVPTKNRKITDHRFPGPDYSIIHPGLFPFNSKAQEMATMAEWLEFDYEAGWGTPEFENNVEKGYEFPKRWKFRPVRVRARDILNEQFAALQEMNELRRQIIKVGVRIGDIEVTEADEDGLEFRVQVTNGTTGHGVPTGFDAERIFFLQVTVTDQADNVIFQSGDRDPNGDLRDLHSLYVHNGELPLDPYLFSLQSKFITRNLRGGEREAVLAVNFSPDPLPFIRPDTRPGALYGRPRGARKHKQVLQPLKSRWANYEVDEDALTGKGPYKANVKLIAQMIPLNLLNEIKDIGFDYGMSARQVGDRVLNGLDPKQGIEGAQVIWERELILEEGAISRHKVGAIGAKPSSEVSSR